ncbi:hypothetical protein PIB30_047212 [Stylosanthes scabra]|uniref:Uncharacterized protein n=1 Tax=Stylosanthes scabra TaxID=79078 RepID=A0ABU6UFI6_9FABA|nr:hypothetical protein [Stylosanthes scabra]
MSSSSDDEARKKGRKSKNQHGPKKKGVDSRCSPSGINKIMTSIINDNARMAEVDAMGFASLQYIPEWIVNQEIYMYLATKFDVENNVIKDDVANIEINAEIVERALGLPSCGDEFSEYYPDGSEYEALKSRWGKFTLADLKGFVIKCAMQTEEQRMLFREAFILFLGKTFFCPTTNSFLSPERHFPLVVDVKNPMQYNWSLQIFTSIKDAIKDFQKKGVKHLSA